jgi:hypothetical protein
MVQQMVDTALAMRAPFAAVNPENAEKTSFRAWRFDRWHKFIIKPHAEGEGESLRETVNVEFDADGKYGPYYSLRAAAVESPINERQIFQMHYLVQFDFQNGAWNYTQSKWCYQSTVGQWLPVDVDSSHNAFFEHLFQRTRQSTFDDVRPGL